MAPSHAATGDTRRRRRAIWWTVGGLLVVVLAALAWVGIRALIARDALEEAIPLATDVSAAIVAGDPAKASAVNARFVERVDEAASLTGDPIWRAVEIIPGLGPNLSAFREAASIAQEVAHDAVDPLTDLASGLDVSSLRPVDGAVDLAPLVALQKPVRAASDALADARARSEAIDTANILEPVRSGVDRLRDAVAEASTGASAVDRIATLVPAMLGQDGPRRYLLLFQNPAELRATGGITGALALVGTDGGRISLLQQASSSDFSRFDPPVLPLPDETTALYGDIPARYIQNVTETPSFPLSGQLARQMWLQRFGGEVDGVLSVDPVALSYLLRATGPLTLPTGDVLTADNAVQLLLSDVYSRYKSPAAQDAFFAAAAATVFERVSGGDLDPRTLIDALSQAGEERRILLWSTDEAEQEIVAETSLAGELPRSDASAKHFGVYLNDATGAKMDYYLDTRFSLGSASCGDDGETRYVVGVTLTNTAPADAASALPEYVTGGGNFGVTPGNLKTQVNVYGAEGTASRGVTRDGVRMGFRPALDQGYAVSQVTIELAPGESTTLEFGFTGDSGPDEALDLENTPVIYSHETEVLTPNCESALW